jgi:hypothetical protein
MEKVRLLSPNGDVILADYGSKRVILAVNTAISFAPIDESQKDKYPDWYKQVAGREFIVAEVRMKHKYSTGGFVTGMLDSVDYIVLEKWV